MMRPCRPALKRGVAPLVDSPADSMAGLEAQAAVDADAATAEKVVFGDEDGDGKFETRKVFAEKLNLVSGIELGFGGVYVGARYSEKLLEIWESIVG